VAFEAKCRDKKVATWMETVKRCSDWVGSQIDKGKDGEICWELEKRSKRWVLKRRNTLQGYL